ncbi:MAG: hypothetical protein R2730_03405 [Chitinophagales bacterium]
MKKILYYFLLVFIFNSCKTTYTNINGHWTSTSVVYKNQVLSPVVSGRVYYNYNFTINLKYNYCSLPIQWDEESNNYYSSKCFIIDKKNSVLKIIDAQDSRFNGEYDYSVIQRDTFMMGFETAYYLLELKSENMVIKAKRYR